MCGNERPSPHAVSQMRCLGQHDLGRQCYYKQQQNLPKSHPPLSMRCISTSVRPAISLGVRLKNPLDLTGLGLARMACSSSGPLLLCAGGRRGRPRSNAALGCAGARALGQLPVPAALGCRVERRAGACGFEPVPADAGQTATAHRSAAATARDASASSTTRAGRAAARGRGPRPGGGRGAARAILGAAAGDGCECVITPKLTVTRLKRSLGPRVEPSWRGRGPARWKLTSAESQPLQPRGGSASSGSFTVLPILGAKSTGRTRV
jgi:hypothetical protein